MALEDLVCRTAESFDCHCWKKEVRKLVFMY
jgi:hypothetical protein